MLDSTGYRLQFSVRGVGRKCVRLTELGSDAAERAKHCVEVALRAHRRRQPVPVQTLDWLYQSAPPRLLHALAVMGVVDDRRLLGDALRAWIMTKLQLSEQRVYLLESMVDSLLGHLGDVELESIHRDHLTAWRDTLADRYSPNTVSGYVAGAKQFFRWAVYERLLERSPADGIPCGFQSSTRLQEVPAADVQRLIDACQDSDPELAIALRLGRWGGLRRSEILRVRVEDVQRDKILVRDQKRAKHGYAIRELPVFPELRIVRDFADRRRAQLTATATGRQLLLLPKLGGLTSSAMALRAQRLCVAIGIEPWPRMFQNMRATRQSELLDAEFHVKDVCKWIGNSPDVMMRHYAMVTHREFNRAMEDQPEANA